MHANLYALLVRLNQRFKILCYISLSFERRVYSVHYGIFSLELDARVFEPVWEFLHQFSKFSHYFFWELCLSIGHEDEINFLDFDTFPCDLIDSIEDGIELCPSSSLSNFRCIDIFGICSFVEDATLVPEINH